MEKFGIQNLYTEGCCGVRQLCGFSDIDEADNGDFVGTYPQIFNWINDLPKGLVYQMWFVRSCKWDNTLSDTFDAAELMELIKTKDGVICLGTTLNPNSGNIIEGYQWIAK